MDEMQIIHAYENHASVSHANLETLEAMNNANSGVNMHGPFYSVQSLMADLNADD